MGEFAQIAIPYDFTEECSGYDMTTGQWCCEAHELRSELADTIEDDTDLF